MKKEERVRSKFAIALAIAAVCVTAAWAGWYPEEQITTSRTGKDLRMYNGRKVVVAADGVRHLVWGGVYYNRYYPQSGWTVDYKVSGRIKNSCFPAIALDPNGTDIHVVWEGSGRIYYQKCVPGPSGTSGWVGSPKDITPDATAWLRAPAVACYRDVDNVDHVVVTWFEWTGLDSIGFRECVGGNWGATVHFGFQEVPGHTPTLWNPSIATDPQGRYGDVFLLYLELDPDYLWVVRRQGVTWQDPECVVTGYAPHATIEVDATTGYPHVVCDASGISHTYWDPENGWWPLEPISAPGAISYGPPSMCFSNGSGFVAWSETTSSAGGIRYAIGRYGTWTSDWLTHRYYQDDFDYVSAGASPSGDVYTVYKDEVGRWAQLFGTLYTPGSFSGLESEPIATSRSLIELFPNPAKAGRVTVQYSLPRAEPVRVTLLDVSGRAVRTQSVAESGMKGSFALDAGGLHAGVYILKLESGTTSHTRKLVIQ